MKMATVIPAVEGVNCTIGNVMSKLYKVQTWVRIESIRTCGLYTIGQTRISIFPRLVSLTSTQWNDENGYLR